MSFAYLRLYTGDYLRDTQHLSCAEHGCYLKLLMYCWDQKGPAPIDERKLMGICNARSTDELEALRRVVNEFFVRMEDGFYNKRMQEEVVSAEHYSEASSKGGKRSAEMRRMRSEVRSKDRLKGTLSTLQQPFNSPSTALEGASVASTPTPTTTKPVVNTVLFDTEVSAEHSASPQLHAAIPLHDGSEFNIQTPLFNEFCTLYPAVDIEQTLREIRAWCLSNPDKRKTKRGVAAFLNRWFAKEQNHG